MGMLNEGDAAPAFTTIDQDGNAVSLSDLHGKNVLLWWYPKADTRGWTIEGKGFRDRIQDFDAKNTVVVGISCDTAEENAAFKAKFDFPYALLCDTDRSVSKTYGAIESDDAANPKRISYLIDADGNIKKAYAKVTPADHPDEVLGDI